MRFAQANESPIDELESLDAVESRPVTQRVELRNLPGRRGDNDLSAAICGDAAAGAEVVEARGTLDTQLGFQ